MAKMDMERDDRRRGSDWENAVVIDDDDIPQDVNFHRQLDVQRARVNAAIEARMGDLLIDLDPEEDINNVVEGVTEDILESEIGQVIDLTTHDDAPDRYNLEPPLFRDREYIWDDGIVLKRGVCVELHAPLSQKYLSFFLKISDIIPVSGNSVKLRGYQYTRTKNLNGVLASKLNEVCQLVSIDNNNPAPWKEQALVETHISNVKGVRVLRVTNAAYPTGRFEPDVYKLMGHQWVTDHCPLVCRFRYVRHFHDMARDDVKPCEWALIRNDEDDFDVDAEYRVSSDTLANVWRGGRVLGGSYIPGDNQQHRIIPEDGSGVSEVVDLETPSSPTARGHKIQLKPGQQYTAGDTFSGAGGAARGIERAGVRLVFCVDNWEPAIESLQKNFPDSKVHGMDVHDFIGDTSLRYRVDMLHLSPPCQPYSPAHTIAGKDDDRNVAALYSCPALINKTRPRLFTVEQTFGILHAVHAPLFHLLLRGFTDSGYSLRWRVCNLASYGLPQPRRRVIIIGAGPGERLPPFPGPTHNEDCTGGLQRYKTVREALEPLRRRPLRDHRLHVAAPKNYRPWCPDLPLPRTITCNGGQNYHWSGRRDFSLQEYALLQGFPAWHRFGSTHVKRQIGNAFPSSVVRIFYKHFVRWLDEVDGVEGVEVDGKRRRGSNSGVPLPRLGTSVAVIPPVVVEDDDDDRDEEEEIKVVRVKRVRNETEVEGQIGFEQPERRRKKKRRKMRAADTTMITSTRRRRSSSSSYSSIEVVAVTTPRNRREEEEVIVLSSDGEYEDEGRSEGSSSGTPPLYTAAWFDTPPDFFRATSASRWGSSRYVNSSDDELGSSPDRPWVL
ncbi:S-adenosyl-L-methionine-dependent methyltransferase [Echria macrotheca]|uniref:DNA (cytosine-5-)-methyltransferase n=1 Tax=Echria macrotheca TaxID=438768 RepID=A0AAJ0F7W9_9PEZI|nr:S-adenosyl-L-methionine-dependent methyltransferase [Echria macrotheca]